MKKIKRFCFTFTSAFSAFNDAGNNDAEQEEEENGADDDDDHPGWTDARNWLFELVAVAGTFFEIGNILIFR